MPDFTPDSPEALIEYLPPEVQAGTDILSCLLLRACATTTLLMNEFMEERDNRSADEIILNALWCVRGHIDMARELIVRRPVVEGAP